MEEKSTAMPRSPLCVLMPLISWALKPGDSLKQRGRGVKGKKQKQKQTTTKPPTTKKKKKKEKNNNSLYRIYMITSLTQAEIPEAPGLHLQGGRGPTGSSPILVRMTPGHNSHFP